MAAGYGGSDATDIQEQTTPTIEETANLFESAYDYPLEIKEIFADRVARIENLDPEIDGIVFNTERAVKGLITNKREFIYKNGSFVKGGKDYHIHYTKYNDEYFMTGFEHNKMSRLIYPYDLKQTNYGYYNTLNKQSPLHLLSKSIPPTEDDYDNGSFTRYFAQKANENYSSIFEISVDEFQTSSLYEYISINWYLVGATNVVYSANSLEIFKARQQFPTINKILTPFQYFKYKENLSDLDSIRNKLAGFENFLSNSSYNTTTQNPGAGADNIFGDGSAGGVCSLGPEYTTKEACIAAGGTWSESGLLDSDGNYTSAANADGQLYDANGNPLENPDDVCK